ncbi:hypothetical protein A2W14_01160 [Candidatus Gottesmanbacteria bacterium RBG_16_37_8]|uniref:HTH cro/C1-type domain-containing protein n=1 Tax=Candidatus Gottesmanbacteria bacterium RBG_16_37_8 TaxID=1798371 RepID=A0A1F5YRX7_9BACT|nr:MAG: hypothetical protein A2W14_01160 [Candidatus Gottesmanbacteria bacterium RBG_16_37_8]
MRTVGEILKNERLNKKLSFEEIEAKIKIRKKYLQALEENSWNKLPSLAYIKGFIKNYSTFLNLNPDDILAVFRRQYQYDEKEEVIPEGISAPINEPVIKFTPQTVFLLLTSIFIVIFFINLFFQYRAIISPPNLIVERPNEGEVLNTETLDVKGKTDADAVVEINNKRIALNEKGEFMSTFSLQPGINTVIIESISKHGKKKTITRTVSVETH